jgi:hypothetical protein
MRTHTALALIVSSLFILAFAGVCGVGYYKLDEIQQKESIVAAQEKKYKAKKNGNLAMARAKTEAFQRSEKERTERVAAQHQIENERANSEMERRRQDQLFQDKLKEIELKQQKEADAIRIGSMGAGERRQSLRALQIVKERGQDGFERLSPTIIQQAARLDPYLIADMQKKLGEQRIKEGR